MSLPEPRYLLWLDLETSDLSPSKGEILEIGAVLTEFRYPYDEVGRFQSVVRADVLLYQAASKLTFEEFVAEFAEDHHEAVVEMHLDNGLLAESFQSKDDRREVQRRFMQWLTELVPDKGTIRIAGSGVGPFDVPYMRHHMPLIPGWCQYRVLDISSVRTALESVGKPQDDGADGKHRALGDALSALACMRRLANAFVGI